MMKLRSMVPLTTDEKYCSKALILPPIQSQKFKDGLIRKQNALRSWSEQLRPPAVYFTTIFNST